MDTTKKEAVGFHAYADLIGKFGGGVVVRESQYLNDCHMRAIGG